MLTVADTIQTFMRDDSLVIVDARGRRRLIGNEAAPPTATIHLGSRAADLSIALRPGLAFGEAYMSGALTIEGGTIYDVLAAIARNFRHLPRLSWINVASRLSGRIKQRNPIQRARKNVAHHYDLSPALYDLFLDTDRQYSCAYFANPTDSLETAQANKKRHIASKLLLDRQNLSVLDIGSGWGGLGLYLASETGARVTGLTLSEEQHRESRARSARAGLASRVEFALRDYRAETGRYDRIVSVGMFEHVGKVNYPEFFAKISDLLADDGVALLHSCGFGDEPSAINPFIRKYIFPGADQPSMSEVFAVVERSGLVVTDVEILHLHYAETLRCWRERFVARWDEAARLYDERFCRMWECYLAMCEVGFRYLTSMVFQMQLTHRKGVVPITRDYMFEAEHRLRTDDIRAMAAD